MYLANTLQKHNYILYYYLKHKIKQNITTFDNDSLLSV